MPFQITLWTPVDNQKINQKQKINLHIAFAPLTSNEVDSHCSYGFFRHHELYRWSATKAQYYFIRKSCGSLNGLKIPQWTLRGPCTPS